MVRLRRAYSTIKTATAVTGARPAYAAGFRASIATVIPLAASQMLGWGEAATWLSLGGFNGALSDRGGSYRARALTMATLLATGALAAALGSLASGHLAFALPLTFAIAFAASLLRAWGMAGISVGGATLSVYVVALALPIAHPLDALNRAGFVAMGGLWAMAIALVLWPLRPYRPARLAIATSFTAFSEYASQVADFISARAEAREGAPPFPAGSATVRTALENARAVLVRLRRGRPGSIDRGERLLVLGEAVDQLFGHVVALNETIAGVPASARRAQLDLAASAIIRDVASTALMLAAAVESETLRSSVPVSWTGDTIRALLAGSDDPHYAHVAVIVDRLAQYASVASATASLVNGGSAATDPAMTVTDAHAATVAGERAEVPNEEPFMAPVRSMLSPDSVLLRFALRVAVVTTIAVALTDLLDLRRGYWVTITVIVILQPYTGVTLHRAVQRVLGTVLGGLLAALLGAFFHDPRAILAIAFVFVASCVALLPLNYAAFSIFLTPTFVLLAEAGAGDWHLAHLRVYNTLLGGALALVGSRLLWPSPERSRFPTELAAALRANRAYLDAVIAHYDDRSDEASRAMRAARRAIGLAAVNTEESLQRMIEEEHGDADAVAPALVLVTYIRRFSASVTALAISRHADDDTSRADLAPFVSELSRGLGETAAAVEAGATPPESPQVDVSGARLPVLVTARIERLRRQLGTLHDAATRLASAGAAAGDRTASAARALESSN